MLKYWSLQENRITSKGIGVRQANTENQTPGKVTEPPKPDTVGKIVSEETANQPPEETIAANHVFPESPNKN